jgi:hypothetical protein
MRKTKTKTTKTAQDLRPNFSTGSKDFKISQLLVNNSIAMISKLLKKLSRNLNQIAITEKTLVVNKITFLISLLNTR